LAWNLPQLELLRAEGKTGLQRFTRISPTRTNVQMKKRIADCWDTPGIGNGWLEWLRPPLRQDCAVSFVRVRIA